MNGASDAYNKLARTPARRFVLTNECSVTVASERLYYKFFAEQKASMFHRLCDPMSMTRSA
jgi:hypothetical protein